MPSKRKSPRARAPAFVFDCLMGSLSVLWDRDGPAARDVDLVIHELYQLPVRRLLLFRSVLSPPVPRSISAMPYNIAGPFLSIIFSCRMILTCASVSDDGNQITQFIVSAICLVDSDFPPLNDIYVRRCSSGNIIFRFDK